MNFRFIVPLFGFSFAVSSFPLAAQTGQGVLRDTFCSDQNVVVAGQIFNAARPSGTVVLPGAASNGGDSTVLVDLFYTKPVEIDYTITLCEGDTVYFNGHAYHAFMKSGTEVFPGMPCDSIFRVKVDALPAPFSYVRDTLCPGDFLMINGTIYDKNRRAGYEIIKNGSWLGCDSIVAIDLEFRNSWIYAGEDMEIIKGDFACISPLYGFEPVKVEWMPFAPCADSSCIDSCFRVTDPIVFTLIATDPDGCVLIDDIRVLISKRNRVYAPNVFSPNAYWPDNYFWLSTDGAVVNIRRFIVADRWGEILYEATNIQPNNPEYGWDGYFRGKAMMPDTYLFFAELERYDGTIFQNQGGFSLVR